MERILGIDPGFGRIGYGVIEQQRNGSSKVIAYGCIETSAKDEFINRLGQVHDTIKEVIKKYNPTQAAVEELFFYKNVTTAIQVGQARGVILLTLLQAKLPVYEFTPLEVKQALTGYGRAEKGQIQKMVMMILGIKAKSIQDDAADALAIALTAAAGLKLSQKVNSIRRR